MCRSVDKDRTVYMLHSKLAPYMRRISNAEQVIKSALSQCSNPVMSFSSGKDSIVMLDLAVKAGFDGELIFFRYGISTDVETPQENIELLRYYADKYALKYTIIDCLGEVDCWEQCGRFILFPETESERRIFDRTNHDYAVRSEEYCRSKGFDLHIIGMRKAESKHRRIMLSKKGSIYQAKSREALTCCPIANLTNDDIWAYIFVNDLKYLSIYDYPYMERTMIRNEITMLYNDAIMRNGMMYHYKNMYPDFFAWLNQRYHIT